MLARVDACCTAAGSRTLRRWIAAPLRDPARVAERQDAVAALGGTSEGRRRRRSGGGGGRLRRALRRAPDLERCVGRARAASAASASDARALPPEPPRRDTRAGSPRSRRRLSRRETRCATSRTSRTSGRARPRAGQGSVRAAHPRNPRFGASDALEASLVAALEPEAAGPALVSSAKPNLERASAPRLRSVADARAPGVIPATVHGRARGV